MREDDFLNRLQNGDELAWKQFVDEWGQRLYDYARYNNLPTPEDMQDVVSETMIALVRAIPRFDGKVKLSTFIYSIASRKVADFWRRHRNNIGDLPETLSTPGPSPHGIDLADALNRMPEQERQALLLRYREGLGVAEIAQALGKTYKGAESLLSRSRKRLEKELGGSAQIGK